MRDKLARWLRSTWCRVLGGHYKQIAREPHRLTLRCAWCGHESPGWEIGTTRRIA